MSLTEADVRRLERAGHRDFCDLGDDGALRLRNLDGRCSFLAGGRCVAYADRPDGCVLYPLIWFTEEGEDGRTGEAGLHEFCDHRNEFRFSQGDREWLERSIAAEDVEVAARLRGIARPDGNTEVNPSSDERTTRHDV
jgi:Fe-S-cluster containining protein